MCAQVEMPLYQCYKRVHALKIVNVLNTDDVCRLFFGEPYAPIDLPKSFKDKHDPEIGGYYVVYSDGYASYSPEVAFESGYVQIKR